jgi:gamma-glutamylcyclotransferase (GGCT)/AIG2-like uncharacterized protein YtfP
VALGEARGVETPVAVGDEGEATDGRVDVVEEKVRLFGHGATPGTNLRSATASGWRLSDIMIKLFVYGSLMQGLPAHHLVAGSPGAAKLGPAWIEGRLLDLGEYPGAVLDGGTGRIAGELWELPASRLPELDAYEGYAPDDLAGSLFVRRRVNVHRDEQAIRAWTYVVKAPPSGAGTIPGGDWRRHSTRQR